MDQQQARQVADRFIEQLHRLEQGDPGAVDGIVSMFADDAHLSNPLIERDGGSRTGSDSIRQFWQEYRNSFRHIQSEFVEVTTNDHSAGLFWHSNGTDANGSPLEYDGVTLLVLDDSGKILHFHGYFDTAQTRH